jgi:hypothetical protein
LFEVSNLLLVLANSDGLDLLSDVGDGVLDGLDGSGDDGLLGLLGAVGGWGGLLGVELLDVLLGLGDVLG